MHNRFSKLGKDNESRSTTLNSALTNNKQNGLFKLEKMSSLKENL